MNIIDIILTVIILVVIGGAVSYIHNAKKRGEKCIGCPYAKQCGTKNCGCGNSKDNHSDN